MRQSIIRATRVMRCFDTISKPGKFQTLGLSKQVIATTVAGCRFETTGAQSSGPRLTWMRWIWLFWISQVRIARSGFGIDEKSKSPRQRLPAKSRKRSLTSATALASGLSRILLGFVMTRWKEYGER